MQITNTKTPHGDVISPKNAMKLRSPDGRRPFDESRDPAARHVWPLTRRPKRSPRRKAKKEGEGDGGRPVGRVEARERGRVAALSDPRGWAASIEACPAWALWALERPEGGSIQETLEVWQSFWSAFLSSLGLLQ